MPPIIALGARYIHDKNGREVFDIELDAVYEAWSIIEEYDVQLDGAINGQELDRLVVRKDWQDTVSLRLGSDFTIVEDLLTWRVGTLWESPAAKHNYSYIDLSVLHAIRDQHWVFGRCPRCRDHAGLHAPFPRDARSGRAIRQGVLAAAVTPPAPTNVAVSTAPLPTQARSSLATTSFQLGWSFTLASYAMSARAERNGTVTQ